MEFSQSAEIELSWSELMRALKEQVKILFFQHPALFFDASLTTEREIDLMAFSFSNLGDGEGPDTFKPFLEGYSPTGNESLFVTVHDIRQSNPEFVYNYSANASLDMVLKSMATVILEFSQQGYQVEDQNYRELSRVLSELSLFLTAEQKEIILELFIDVDEQEPLKYASLRKISFRG